MLRDSLYARLSRVDACLALALGLLTFGVAFHYAPLGAYSGFVDMAHDGYQLRLALDLSHGAVIFRDTFDQYGPLSGYLNAIGFLTLGHTLLAMKYFVAGWYGLIAITLFVLARYWLRPALAAFSVLVWLGLAPFYQHGIMLSPHVYVLFLQAVATILLLKSPGLDPRVFAIAGVLAGLSFGMKQTMGTLYAGAILAYLSCLLVLQRRHWMHVVTAASSFVAAYCGLIAVLLAALWSRGALHDWYLQTVVFPRDLYAGGSGVSYVGLLQTFVQLQAGQSLYWFVIRGVVIVAALAQIIRGRGADDLLLIAAITGGLWLAAFPSAAFMHQWWTISLGIPVFIAALHQLVRWMTGGREGIATLGVMIVAGLIVQPGVSARLKDGANRAVSYTAVLSEPAILRGIRTEAHTQRAFDAVLRVMTAYRANHPGTKVVSMNPSGTPPGLAVDESILFLSFFDDNTHASPLYWSVPVLTTKTYPDYVGNLWNEIRATHPVIVEYRAGGYTPASVPGYFVLLGAEADLGYWYIYAPEHAEREQHGETSLFLPRQRPVAPPVVAPPDPSENPIGQWRGMVSRPGGAVDVYSWPADLPSAEMDGRTEPFVEEPIGRSSIVHRVTADTFQIDGSAEGRFSYLTQYSEKELPRGRRLVIRGELFEGGLQPGFLRNAQWCCSVAIARPGAFEAVIRIPRAGAYQFVLGNDLEATKWEILRAHWLRGTLNLFTGRYMPTRSSISTMAWMP